MLCRQSLPVCLYALSSASTCVSICAVVSLYLCVYMLCRQPLPVCLYALQNMPSTFTCVSVCSAQYVVNLYLCIYMLRSLYLCVFSLYLCVCMLCTICRQSLSVCLYAPQNRSSAFTCVSECPVVNLHLCVYMLCRIGRQPLPVYHTLLSTFTCVSICSAA